MAFKRLFYPGLGFFGILRLQVNAVFVWPRQLGAWSSHPAPATDTKLHFCSIESFRGLVTQVTDKADPMSPGRVDDLLHSTTGQIRDLPRPTPADRSRRFPQYPITILLRLIKTSHRLREARFVLLALSFLSTHATMPKG